MLPDEPDTRLDGAVVIVIAPEPSADRSATCGKLAMPVDTVPEPVDDSSVVNVEAPGEDGAVAPAPPRLMSPYTIWQVPPDGIDTLVTRMVAPIVPTLPQVEVTGPVRAKIVVRRADGSVANETPFELAANSR